MNFSRSKSNYFILDNLLQNRRKLKIEMLQNRSEKSFVFRSQQLIVQPASVPNKSLACCTKASRFYKTFLLPPLAYYAQFLRELLLCRFPGRGAPAGSSGASLLQRLGTSFSPKRFASCWFNQDLCHNAHSALFGLAFCL